MMTDIFPLPPNSTGLAITIFRRACASLFGLVVFNWNCISALEHIIVNLNEVLYELLSSYTIALYQFRHRREYAAGAAANTLIVQHYHRQNLFAISISSYLRALFVYFTTFRFLLIA